MTRLSLIFAVALLLASGGSALAQFGGQPGGGGFGPGMGPPPQGEDGKEEGPAEAAPDEDTERPGDMEPLGSYPGQQRRTTQIVEIDGYLRVRTDWLHNLNLGQKYVMDGGNLRLPPYPLPLECGTIAAIEQNGCGSKNFGGGNLRLRLEPTINISDQVRVVSQVDVLDNTVMGSTADSIVSTTPRSMDRSNLAPSGALSGSQDPPEVGRNGYLSSIRAKRAWGEVDTEFGSLRFGRMPWHFGRGIAFHNGNCADCEGGTTVDRIMAISQVYGHQLAVAWDFGYQGYHLGAIDTGRHAPSSPPMDLSQDDDVFQLMAAFTLVDDDRKFRDKVDAGELAVNYGVQIVYRNQNADVYDLATPDRPGAGMTTGDGTLTRDDLAGGLATNVDTLMFLPGLWFKLGWKILTIEAEAQAVLGRIDNAGPLAQDPSNKHLTVQQIGWVLATELRLYRNAFFLGFETGGATGDQAENTASYLNHRWKFVQQPTGDTRLTDFKFNPDYQVDQILFRRIYGSISNAIYVKPSMIYWMDLVEQRQLGLSAAILYSLAPVRVATPGNSLSYGIEVNFGLSYRNPADGFYAGATYGVLWPMGALDRGIGAAGVSDATWRTQDASSAQVFRTFLGIKF